MRDSAVGAELSIMRTTAGDAAETVRTSMHREPSDWPITALIYTDGARAADVLRRLVGRLQAAGATCAGFIQHDEPSKHGGARCDMVLECLSSGARIKISEDRGPLARGCRLDMSELMRALSAARDALKENPDVLVINKFGKSESEGGGFRTLIADAIELGVPVLVAVPWRNIESWRLFAGELATEIAVDSIGPDDDRAVLSGLGLHVDKAPRPAGPHKHH